MTGIAIVAGALITFVEPGTTSPICGQVRTLAEGAGGEPIVWAVQQGGSRAFKAPVADVKPGCAASPARTTATVPTAGPAGPPPTAPAVAPALPASGVKGT